MAIYGVGGNYSNYAGYQNSINRKTEKNATESCGVQKTDDTYSIGNSVADDGGQFKSVSEYSSYLAQRYSYFGRSAMVEGVPTTVAVSGVFLSKCMEDAEKAEYLESNLNAITDSISYAKSHSLGTLVNASYSIDDNGNISMATISTNDPDGKIAKENAEKKAEAEQEIEEKAEARRNKAEEYREMIEERVAKNRNMEDEIKNGQQAASGLSIKV